jgi:hypothetical protein
MLRGVVGGAFFVEALRWVPDIQNSDVDLVLQYGCVGGAAISAAVLLWGVASGR